MKEVQKASGNDKYDDILQIFPDLIWEIDDQGKFEFCSRGKNWGINSEDLVGTYLVDHMPPEEKLRLSEMFKKSISDPQPFSFFESVYVDEKGNKIYLESNGTPVFGEDRKFLGYRGVTRDITRRKIAEEKLIENTELSKNQLLEIEDLFNSLPVGLCVLDLDLKFVRVNDRLAEINGIPASEHIGKRVQDIVPDLAEMTKAIAAKILETGEAQLNVEITGKTKAQPDVNRSWSENWTPIKNKSGRITGISIAVIETTQQVKARERLRKKQLQLKNTMKDLEASQRKLNIALENAKIGLWDLDLKASMLTWDERAAGILNTGGKRQGSVTEISELIHEEDVEYIKSSFREAIINGTPCKVVFRTKDPRRDYSYISASALLSKDEEGFPSAFAGVCMDVTEMRKGTEATLMKLNEELLRSNNDLLQFAYVASHDLQEPLRMVSSFSQLLQHRYKDKLDKDANDYINFAVDGAKRMYSLINGLLAYSRVQTMGREFQDVDMNVIVERVKSNLQLVIKERRAVIYSSHLPVIEADENQMMQLMQNLIENAIKFSKESPRITICSESTGAYYEFSVKDTGIGIAPQYSDRIFRIFQKLHSPTEYAGTGIGLAICKRIVNRHDGNIWVISGTGEGSIFYFTIPKIRRIRASVTPEGISPGR